MDFNFLWQFGQMLQSDPTGASKILAQAGVHPKDVTSLTPHDLSNVSKGVGAAVDKLGAFWDEMHKEPTSPDPAKAFLSGPLGQAKSLVENYLAPKPGWGTAITEGAPLPNGPMPATPPVAPPVQAAPPVAPPAAPPSPFGNVPFLGGPFMTAAGGNPQTTPYSIPGMPGTPLPTGVPAAAGPGAPMNILPEAQTNPAAAAAAEQETEKGPSKLAKALAGIKAPPAPAVQKVSSPPPARQGAISLSSPVAALLQRAIGGDAQALLSLRAATLGR